MIDSFVKNHLMNGKVKRSKFKARDFRVMRRTLAYAAMTTK